MRTLKRMLAALMALTMVGVLGACGGGSDDSKSASSSEAESAYKVKDAGEHKASLVDDMVKKDPDKAAADSRTGNIPCFQKIRKLGKTFILISGFQDTPDQCIRKLRIHF